MTENEQAGRDPMTGRFTDGNAGGPGSPHVRSIAKLRSALFACITDADVKAAVGVIRDLMQNAASQKVRLEAARLMLELCGVIGIRDGEILDTLAALRAELDQMTAAIRDQRQEQAQEGNHDETNAGQSAGESNQNE
jgi:hypothetical protein